MTKEAIRYVKNGLSREKLFNALDCIELLEKENEKLKEENEQLKQSNRELLKKIEKMKCCYNCESYIDDDAYDLCKICNEFSKWELADENN